jgi:hypothetical protein
MRFDLFRVEASLSSSWNMRFEKAIGWRFFASEFLNGWFFWGLQAP